MTERRDEEAKNEIAATLRLIDEAWLSKKPAGLAELLDEHVAMVLPGFSGRVEGRENMVAGFADFCESAIVDSYETNGLDVDVIGDVGVATFCFEMVYERDGSKYLSTGRDLWVLVRREGRWRAVWRTMLDIAEEPQSG